MSKTFLLESSEAFLNLKSLHYPEQKKKISPACFNRVLGKALRKKTCFIWLLKKETFWHSFTSFE